MILLAALLQCASHPRYTLRPLVSTVSVRREGSAYVASASLRFRIVPAFGPARSDHVRGHQIIAQRVSGSSVGSVRARGASAQAARTQIKRAISQMSSDAQHELDREEHVYDTVTEDGLAQDQGPTYGFPGGANSRDRCSP